MQQVKWVGKKAGENPLAELSPLNAETDKRWERRTLSPDEFSRLVDAALVGPTIQCVEGIDRAMLYILAAWTGYRRGELASLTKRSFDFSKTPATVKVQAGYSKRRKKDAIPLHPDVVARLQEWLSTKDHLKRTEPLFNLTCAGGGLRRTAKMMRLDLEAARTKWIEEPEADETEQQKRLESDYLCYQDEEGMYADFHANRHIFISNLSRAGIAPKMAQLLARHSDLKLTMNVYTHVEMDEQASAINTLPTPPSLRPLISPNAADAQPFAQGFAKNLAADDTTCHLGAADVTDENGEHADESKKNPW